MSYEDDVAEYASEMMEDSRQNENMRKMFVGGLNKDTTDDTLGEYFASFGEIEDKVILTDPHTSRSRGFGFITYVHSESVEAVFKSRPHIVDQKSVDVKRAMPREFNTPSAHAKTKRLFVGGFKGLDLEPSELQQYIESRHPADYGVIEKIDILKEKGVGFLECSSFDFADRLAISETSFSLKGRNLSIKKAEPRNGTGGRGGGRGSFDSGRGRGGRGSFDGGRGRGGGGGFRGGSGFRGRGGGNYGSSGQGGNYGNNDGFGGGSGTYGGGGGYGGNRGGGYGGYQGSEHGGNQGGAYSGFGGGDAPGANNNQYDNNSNQGYSTGGGYVGGGYNQRGGGGGSYNQRGGGGGSYDGQSAGNYNPYGRGGGGNRYQPY